MIINRNIDLMVTSCLIDCNSWSSLFSLAPNIRLSIIWLISSVRSLISCSIASSSSLKDGECSGDCCLSIASNSFTEDCNEANSWGKTSLAKRRLISISSCILSMMDALSPWSIPAIKSRLNAFISLSCIIWDSLCILAISIRSFCSSNCLLSLSPSWRTATKVWTASISGSAWTLCEESWWRTRRLTMSNLLLICSRSISIVLMSFCNSIKVSNERRCCS